MEQALQTFEKAWQKFETNFKGKLLAKSKAQSLSLSAANLILKEASGEWFSGYGAEGKWLSDYKKECPDRAEAIVAILKHELRLSENEAEPATTQDTKEQATAPQSKLIAPAAGAVIGAGIGSMIAGPIGAMVGAGGGAALAHNLAKGKSVASGAKDGKTDLNGYVVQLQRYKKKIISVIQ